MEVSMKKTVLLTAALLLAVAGGLYAQEAEGERMTDHRLFGLELGVLAGYDLGAAETFAGRTFSVLLPVHESMQFGIKAINGFVHPAPGTANDYVLLTAEYFLTPELGIDLMAGQGPADIGGGVLVFYNLLKSNPGNGFSSALSVQAGYLFDATDGIANGTIDVGIVGSFGL
jgi:hypothetical protein